MDDIDPLIEIDAISANGAPLLLPDLIRILNDAVEHGASVGFLHPLSHEAARRYWTGMLDELRQNERLIWIARANGILVGTVQLALCPKENGRNRAEVQKLMVHSRWRCLGIASRLMASLEAAARRLNLGLLVLDTEAGSLAEGFYASQDYQRIGMIPDYAKNPAGELKATAVYYKLLNEPAFTTGYPANTSET